MRENISILWVEDSKSYYEEAKDILEMHAEDKGIKVNFKYVENAFSLLEELDKQAQGFQIHDICFIDKSCIFVPKELKRVQDGLSDVRKSLPAMP